MNNQEINLIRRRLQATSGSVWTPCIEGREFTSGSSFVMVTDGGTRKTDIELIGATIDDIDFIGHSKEDVARLIDEVVRLKSKIKDE